MPLFLVPTPVGNLEDITLRALRILKEADLIACEDTRTSKILLNHYEIFDKKLISFHIHNENQKLPILLEKLRNGKKIAVVTDAGTPGISDPGWILLKRSIEENIEVDVLPGASALLPGILLSGINPDKFFFAGFPPEKTGERKKFFDSLKNFQYTLCFYISPHKAINQISEIIKIFGDRKCSLIREISKIHQEALRGNLSFILEKLNEGIKGEFVLVIEGSKKENTEIELWHSKVDEMIESGESIKNIVNEISEKYFVKKNDIKKYIITLISPKRGG